MPGYTKIHGVDVINGLIAMVEAAATDTTGHYRAQGVVYNDKQGNKKYQEVYGKQFQGKAGRRHAPQAVGECRDPKKLYVNDDGKWCLHPCKQGYERNPETLRCFKPKAVRRRRMACREGYGRNPATGRCVKQDDLAVRRAFKRAGVGLQDAGCVAGKYRAHSTKRCRKIPAGGVPANGPFRRYMPSHRSGGIDAANIEDDVDHGGYLRPELHPVADVDGGMQWPVWDDNAQDMYQNSLGPDAVVSQIVVAAEQDAGAAGLAYDDQASLMADLANEDAGINFDDMY